MKVLLIVGQIILSTVSSFDILLMGKETKTPFLRMHAPIDPDKPNITLAMSGTLGMLMGFLFKSILAT